MKKTFLLITTIIFLLISCGKDLLEDKSPEDMNYNQALSYIMKNQKKASPELYAACEKVLPAAVEDGNAEDYIKVMQIYISNPDTFSTALTLAGLTERKTENPILDDSLFTAAKRAYDLSQTALLTVMVKTTMQDVILTRMNCRND